MVDIVLLFLVLITGFFAVRVVFAKDTITNALSLVMVFVCLSVIYGMLGAHFLAVMQLIVYAGAIMILFIFAIMLLNIGKSTEATNLSTKSVALKVAISLGFFLVMSTLVIFKSNPNQGFNSGFTEEKINELGGNLKVISYSILSTNIALFEVISVLILVALIGAVILGKRSFK